MSPCLSNLLLTGTATPFLHNGVTENNEGLEEVGIVTRNAIGFLIWDRVSEKTKKHNLGSRFKTPHLPIWVTCVNNKWGVLFNPKLDLMKSHAAENRCKILLVFSFTRMDLLSFYYMDVDVSH